MYGLALKLAMAFNSIKYLGSSNPAVEETAESGAAALGGKLIESILRIMKIVMPVIFSIVTVLGVAYAVVLGVNYAKAEENEKREDAKKRLVGAVVGFGIAIVVSVILWILANQNDMWYNLFGTEKPSD